jgi:hypothetical protein
MRFLLLVILVVGMPGTIAIGAEPVALLKTMDGFRKELPAPQTISEKNGVGIKDIDGKDVELSHLAGIAERLEVKNQADCMVLLTYLNDADPKLRYIAARAIENVVHAYPTGMSVSDIIKTDTDRHRQMILTFVEKIEKIKAE